LKVGGDEIDERWLMLDCGTWKRNGSERRYDVHKKKIITKGIREGESGDLMIKKCVRCGRYSEDVNGMAATVPKMFAGMMMRCVCDGSWIIEPWGK
jgi:hypothetical protein